MSSHHVTAIIWLEDDVYVSKCPELEVASCGDTPEQALSNLQEALDLWIINAKELGILENYLPTLATKTKFTSSLEISV